MQDANQSASKGLASTILGLGGGTPNIASSGAELINNLTTGLSKIKRGFTEVVDKVSLFDDRLIQASKSLGQGVVFTEGLNQQFAGVAQNILRIGGNVNDVIDGFLSMSKAMDRTVYLSEKTLFNARLLKEVGVDDATVNSFNKLFDAIGGTFEEAGIQQMNLVNQAKSYGLNVSSFMTTVAAQLTKINQYGFPNGVKDISEMVVKSKLLGANIEAAQRVADKIMGSPEEAIDMAAKMQTLGGSFASLADPMELLYLAQNDLKGLNDKLIDATRGLAVFNKETGQFEVSVQDRLRIKQVAADFGVNASEIIETSTKLAKQEAILSRLNFTPNFQGMGEEEKRIIAQYAQLSKGGEIKLEGKNLESLSAPDIDGIMKKLQGAGSQLVTEGADMADKNTAIIQQNMSTLEKVNMGLSVYENSIALLGVGNEQVNNVLDDLAKNIGGMASTLGSVKQKLTDEFLSMKSKFTMPSINMSGLTGGIPSKIMLEQAAPIKIELTNTANLETVIKSTLANYFANKVNTATGSDGPDYSSGSSSGG